MEKTNSNKLFYILLALCFIAMGVLGFYFNKRLTLIQQELMGMKKGEAPVHATPGDLRIYADTGSITSIVTYDSRISKITAGCKVEIYPLDPNSPDVTTADPNPKYSVVSDANGRAQLMNFPCGFYYVKEYDPKGILIWQGQYMMCGSTTYPIPPNR